MMNQFDNKERVDKAANELIRAVIWESTEIAVGEHEDFIEKLVVDCRKFKEKMVKELEKDCKEYYDSLKRERYEIHLYECTEGGAAIEETAKHLECSDLKSALTWASTFFRSAKNPLVNIYDNVEDKYIAEWC